MSPVQQKEGSVEEGPSKKAKTSLPPHTPAFLKKTSFYPKIKAKKSPQGQETKKKASAIEK